MYLFADKNIKSDKIGIFTIENSRNEKILERRKTLNEKTVKGKNKEENLKVEKRRSLAYMLGCGGI